MRSPLNLKFAKKIYHLSKMSPQGTFGTGRLHSELWDWGVKLIYNFEFLLGCLRTNIPGCVLLSSMSDARLHVRNFRIAS